MRTTKTTTRTKPMYCDPKACTASVQRAAAFRFTWKPKMSRFSSFNHFPKTCRNYLLLAHQCSLLLDEQFFKARTFSKFTKGAALRVPLDKLLLYLEQRLLKRISAGTQTTDNPKCCFVFEPSSLLWQFSFFILILRILLHTPALFLIWIIGTITVDDISSG